MATIKKKDIKRYTFTDLLKKEKDNEKEPNELDELVNSDGSPINGDEVETSSQITTAPQATTDDFNDAAIQPNRYLFNVGGSGYSRGAAVHMESIKKISKNKMLKLVNEIMGNNDDEPISDINNNGINDIKELGSSIISKVKGLINTIEDNNLNAEDTKIILTYINDKLKYRING